MELLDDFHDYLAEHGVSLTELPRKESFAIMKRWTSVYATASDRFHEIRGARAIDHWLAAPKDDLILLFR